MSILVNKETRVLIQGITGTQASFHVKRSMDYGYFCIQLVYNL